MSNTEVLDFRSPENSDKQFVLVIAVTFINCHSVAGSACIVKDEYEGRNKKCYGGRKKTIPGRRTLECIKMHSTRSQGTSNVVAAKVEVGAWNFKSL